MTRKALSDYWASSHHRLLGRTTDEPARLAIALGAAKSIIRVVDRHMPPMQVQWAAVDEKAPIKSMSFTNFTAGTINLNPMPMKDTSISHGHALDVVTGFGIHEAGHSQESRDRAKALLKREAIVKPAGHPDDSPEVARAHRVWDDIIRRPDTVFDRVTGQPTREVPAFEPMRIAAYLWNLVEDVRMETVTARHWPGFKPYFGAFLDWMWGEMRKSSEVPSEYGPDLAGKLRVAYIACRYPEQAARLKGKVKLGRKNLGAVLQREVAWWQAWQDDYITDRVDTPTTILRGLDHLGDDPKTKQELDKMAAEERAERERGEQLRAQLERLINEGVGGTFAVCINDNGEMIPLDAATADEVRQLVREGLVEHEVIIKTSGAANPPVRVRKPEETRESRMAYVGRPSAEVEALRAALVFRASAPEYSEKLLKDGDIDDEELYRWAAGDYRVFGQRIIESKPEVFMGLLVDLSGSMAGKKLEIAQRLAQLFVFAVHDQEGIETAVWGHTADVEEETAEVYRIWEQGDPLTRLGLISTLPHSNNADGHAIAYVAAQIEKASQPEKVLLVLADGKPHASGYGGKPAASHVRSVQRWAMSHGVRVIQIAIDPYGITPAEQAEMFGQEGEGWIGFKDYGYLPRQIANLLGRYI